MDPQPESTEVKSKTKEEVRALLVKMLLADKGEIYLIKDKEGFSHFFSRSEIPDITKVDMSKVVHLDIPFDGSWN